MQSSVAAAYVQIIPSAQGIGNGIAEALGGDKAAASTGESMGKGIGSKLVSTIKGIIAAAGLGAALSKTLTEGGALEQSLGGVETLFKDNADTVKAYAQNAWQTAGLSANDYMETVTGFSASLLQGLSGDTATAAEVANMALIDMSDNANKMGTNMQDIQNAYQGFAKQNYTMLDNLKLGYGGTKSEMQRLLADAQKITGVKYDLDNLADVYTAIHVIQGGVDELNGSLGDVNKGLGITHTTAQEASTTLTGSLAAMQASFQNVLGALTLGQDLQPSLDALAQSVTTFLTGNLLPDIWNILSALPGALATFVQELAPQLVIGLQSLLPQITAALPQMMQGFVDGFSTFLPQAVAVGTQFVASIGSGLVQGIPDFLAQALPMVLQFTETLRTNFGDIVDAGIDLLLNLVQGIANGLPTLIEYVPQIVSNIAGLINDNAPKLLAAGLKITVTLGLGLIQAIPALIANMPQIINAIVSVFTAFNWINLGSNIITMLKNGITSMVSAVQSAGTSIFDAVKNAITNLPSALQSIGSNAIQSLAGGIRALTYDAQMAGVSVFSAIQTAVSQLPAALLSIGKNAVSSMASGLRNMLSSVVSAAQSILSGIVGAVQALPGQLWSLAKSAAQKLWNAFIVNDWNGLGTNIIQGIINGIGSMAGALWDAATNIAKSALDAIKSFFGIASPSKLMQHEIGPYIPQGLALGIEKNAWYVTDAMDDLGMQSTSRLYSTIAAGTPGTTAVSSQSDHELITAINTAARAIVQAVQENGGDIVIGDDVIYHSFNRARQSQSIMLGGAY